MKPVKKILLLCCTNIFNVDGYQQLSVRKILRNSELSNTQTKKWGSYARCQRESSWVSPEKWGHSMPRPAFGYLQHWQHPFVLGVFDMDLEMEIEGCTAIQICSYVTTKESWKLNLTCFLRKKSCSEMPQTTTFIIIFEVKVSTWTLGTLSAYCHGFSTLKRISNSDSPQTCH